MLHFQESGEVVIPQGGDLLLYEIESSTLQYQRPGGEPIVWHSGDDKFGLRPGITRECVYAIGETIAEMFGLNAFLLDNSLPKHMKGRFWGVKLLGPGEQRTAS